MSWAALLATVPLLIFGYLSALFLLDVLSLWLVLHNQHHIQQQGYQPKGAPPVSPPSGGSHVRKGPRTTEPLP